MTRVFWAALLERSIQEYAVSSLLGVAMQCGAQEDYARLVIPYLQTATARNTLVNTFLEIADDPNDTLVMLDCDHIHPVDIVPKLAAHAVGVVGALYFRRYVPHDPLMFMRCKDGSLRSIVEWSDNAKLIPCEIVATGAIAIKRWVFDKLIEQNIPKPWFRYEYENGTDKYASEDMYFGKVCEQAGIKHHCDVTIQIPHLTAASVDIHSWQGWKANNADQIVDPQTVEQKELVIDG